MELNAETLRDVELAAAVRAATQILNDAIEAATDGGLIVTVEMREEEPPRVELAVDRA
jgi:hypothetical protein